MRDMARQRERELYYQAMRRARTAAREARWRAEGRECARCHEVKRCPEEIGVHPNAKVCDECKGESNRRRRREWSAKQRRTNPDFRRRQTAATKRWRDRHRDRHLEYAMAYYAWQKADPERWARHLEDARINYRKRQEAKGKPVRQMSDAEYVTRYGNGYGKSTRVPAAPLVPYVKHALAEFSENELALFAGVSQKRLHEIIDVEDKQISLITADRLCVAFDLPMSLVYGATA